MHCICCDEDRIMGDKDHPTRIFCHICRGTRRPCDLARLRREYYACSSRHPDQCGPRTLHLCNDGTIRRVG